MIRARGTVSLKGSWLRRQRPEAHGQPRRPPYDAGRALLAACLLPGLLVLGAPVSAAPAHAAHPREAAHEQPAGATLLDGYLEGLSTLRGNFVQTLADAQGHEIDRSSGTLIVQRPGKFSWEVHPAGSTASGGQLMVADGRNVWFLDRDLDQVTVKPVDEALSATPAMLLSGTVDLRKHFTVTAAPAREGLDWVLVEPKSTQADFRSALFGFEHTGGGTELARLILEDKLGQVASIYFDQVRRNGPVAAGEVSFTPPAGTDVIGKPR